MNGQDKQWVKLWRENTPEIRDRIIGWRKQTAIIKLDHPSRIARAHRLGYKAKQGIIVVRSRVGTGGMRRQRPRGGRRPKHLGVTRIKADVSMKEVAENWRASSSQFTGFIAMALYIGGSLYEYCISTSRHCVSISCTRGFR